MSAKISSTHVFQWLLVLAWIGAIHTLSGPLFSFANTFKIGDLIQGGFHSGLSHHTVEVIVAVTRKFAHLTEYAILAALLWNAMRPATLRLRLLKPQTAVAILAIVAGVAWLDELSQLFVPGREGQLSDVVIDIIGGSFVVLYLIFRYRKKGASFTEPTLAESFRSGP